MNKCISQKKKVGEASIYPEFFFYIIVNVYY